MKFKANHLPGYAVIRPEFVGVAKGVPVPFWRRIGYRIIYLCDFYMPVACVFTMWIALVYFGAEYINNH